MAYNDMVARAEMGANVPKTVTTALVTAMSAESIALQLGTSVPVTTRDSKVPIVTESPTAGWVTGDTGLKGVFKADFTPQALVAEELATIVPVPDAVLDDSDYPIWDAMRPLLARAAADRAKAQLLAAEMVGIDGYSATVHPDP